MNRLEKQHSAARSSIPLIQLTTRRFSAAILLIPKFNGDKRDGCSSSSSHQYGEGRKLNVQLGFLNLKSFHKSGVLGSGFLIRTNFLVEQYLPVMFVLFDVPATGIEKQVDLTFIGGTGNAQTSHLGHARRDGNGHRSARPSVFHVGIVMIGSEGSGHAHAESRRKLFFPFGNIDQRGRTKR